MKNTVIGLAMSGGVDSTVAALLLQEQGYQVQGFFMRLPLPGIEEHLIRVKQVATQLDIPLRIVDMEEYFSHTIIDYFTTTYAQGLTPNPCIVCNQQIKFTALAEAIFSTGIFTMATGHYARIQKHEQGFMIMRGADRKKDQSYFLARLSSKQIGHVMFPLGEWNKDEVYAKAAQAGFAFQGQESQDVCFLPEGLQPFLHAHGVQGRSGDIVSTQGQVLGRHKGVYHYTVGQRRGLGLPDATPWYVVGLHAGKNQVIVGKNDELFAQSLTVTDVQWTKPPQNLSWQGLVQLRSRHQPAPARMEALHFTSAQAQLNTEQEIWKIIFTSSQRAISPGQFAVFYEDDLVVGSGVIAPVHIIAQES